MSKINNKKIKNILVAGLGILAIPALVASLAPLSAQAQTSGYVTSYGSTQYNNPITSSNNSTTPSRNPKPSVSSINPSSANYGETAKAVTITGSGFVPNSVARVDGFDRPTTFIDSSHLVTYLNASDLAGTNGRYINVFNPAPSGGYSKAAFFTIHGYVAPTNQQTSSGSFFGAPDPYNGQPNMIPQNSAIEDSYGSLASNVIYGSSNFAPSGLTQWVLFAILILLAVIIVRRVLGATKKYHSAPLKQA